MLIGGEFGSFPIKNVVLWEEAFISDTLAPKSAETLIKVVFNVLNRTGKKKSFRTIWIRTPVHPSEVFPAVKDNIYCYHIHLQKIQNSFVTHLKLGHAADICNEPLLPTHMTVSTFQDW